MRVVNDISGEFNNMNESACIQVFIVLDNSQFEMLPMIGKNNAFDFDYLTCRKRKK